jgi:hypothetical protein
VRVILAPDFDFDRVDLGDPNNPYAILCEELTVGGGSPDRRAIAGSVVCGRCASTS